MIRGSATIIDYSKNAAAIVSAAGRLSSTLGSANETYQLSVDKSDEVNNRLIQKILSSGHSSVLEHIVVNLSFDNVSVFVEQFMIEHRLASFTVKSRRYVDFGAAGYVLPDFSAYGKSAQAFRNTYEEYMTFLFKKYNEFVDAGIPKEDARFVLPYSFRSNFFCTVNAREFLYIVKDMVYGRGRNYPEVVLLGESLIQQGESIFPYLDFKPAKNQIDDSSWANDAVDMAQQYRATRREAKVTLLCGSVTPLETVKKAYLLQMGRYPADGILCQVDTQQMMQAILSSPRKRELEQINYTILFNHLSLAGITHLVRHRMQSIVIPEFVQCYDFSDYVIPQTIVEAGLLEQYNDIFHTCGKAVFSLKQTGFRSDDLVYFLLSGLTMPVMTTMNGRELLTFIKLRACNRAQWEIRENAVELLKELRCASPEIFQYFGPSCYVLDYCPEGKMTCGQIETVRAQFISK